MLDFLSENYIYLIILPLVAFLAGFIDSIVGGGGLVQVPSLFILFPQFPVSMVIGSNSKQAHQRNELKRFCGVLAILFP